MLTLLTYGHYVRRPTIRRYAAVFTWLALGLMSKPMLVTVPFVLLLLDYWPLGLRPRQLSACTETAEFVRRYSRRNQQPQTNESDGQSLVYLIVEKIPLLVLAATVAAITYCVQQQSGAI